MTPAERLARRLPRGRLAVGVAGESGVGKTTFAAALAAALAPRTAAVLSQDDWFRLPPRANAARRRRDPRWIGPPEVDLEGLAECIEAFRGGSERLAIRRLDRAADRFERATLRLAEVLIVEGTYVSLLPVDFRVMLLGDWRQTHGRRLARGRDPIDAETDRILRAEHRVIVSHHGLADARVQFDGTLV